MDICGKMQRVDTVKLLSSIPETTNDVAPAEPVKKKPRGRPPIPEEKQLLKTQKVCKIGKKAGASTQKKSLKSGECFSIAAEEFKDSAGTT